MRDICLYEDCDVLKNLPGIKDVKLLNDAEADYVTYRLKEITINPLPGDYNYAHLPLRQLHSELLAHTQGRPLRGSVFVWLKVGSPSVTP